MGLIAAELETRGISTVAIQLLREVAVKVRPPRALFVPFPHGYPLAAADDMDRQLDVLDAALSMLEDPELEPPALVDYHPRQELAKT